MALTPEQLGDFVTLTLKYFEKKKWTDISLEFPEYISSKIISKRNVREYGGPQVNFKVKTANTGLARNASMWEQDVTGVEDVMTEGNVPWSLQTVNWSWHEAEADFQSDRETIISVLQIREHDARSSMAELTENNMWGQPATATDGRPRGIPFWITKDATTTPGGAFNGGNPSSGLTRAGIDSTTYTRWKNWTFGYTQVKEDDWVAKVKKSIYKTNFMAPVPHPEMVKGPNDREIYTTYAVREAAERLAETRNDNLKSDLARYINSVTVAGIPIIATHYLDANDSTDPSYGINWKVFRPYVKKGWDMRRKQVDAPRQHNVHTIHYDTWMNYVCFNLRECFVGSTS